MLLIIGAFANWGSMSMFLFTYTVNEVITVLAHKVEKRIK